MDVELGVGEDDIVLTGDYQLGCQPAIRGSGREGDIAILKGGLGAIGGRSRTAVRQHGLEGRVHLYLGGRGQIDVKVIVKNIRSKATPHFLQILLGDCGGQLEGFGLFSRLGVGLGRKGRQESSLVFSQCLGQLVGRRAGHQQQGQKSRQDEKPSFPGAEMVQVGLVVGRIISSFGRGLLPGNKR